MTTIAGLIFMIKRSGTNGKIGRIVDALQIFETSSLREYCLANGYYSGAAEEWEKFSRGEAGDMDGDGDFDSNDEAVIKTENRKVQQD